MLLAIAIIRGYSCPFVAKNIFCQSNPNQPKSMATKAPRHKGNPLVQLIAVNRQPNRRFKCV